MLLDAHSRRVVGWAMADHLRTELALDALAMAPRARRPGADLVHHTDRGSQYTAAPYRAALAAHAITCSMSRSGECLDNAMAESFFATLKGRTARRPEPGRRAVRPAWRSSHGWRSGITVNAALLPRLSPARRL